MSTRNFLFVEDVARAFEMIILFKGKVGLIYNIGGSNERTNIDVARDLIKLSGHAKPDDMITFVEDRVFNDLRCTVPTSFPSFLPSLLTSLYDPFLSSVFALERKSYSVWYSYVILANLFPHLVSASA